MARPINNSNPKPFESALALFSPSWQALKLNLGTFATFILISLFISILSNIVHGSHPGLSLFLNLISYIVGVIFSPAIFITQLKSVRHQKIEFVDALKQGLPYVFRIFILNIVVVVMVIVGLVCLIVPGIILLRRYLLAPYYLLDRDIDIVSALKLSASQSKEYKSLIYGVIGVLFVIAITCLIFVGLVLLAAYYCAPAVLYSIISHGHHKTASLNEPSAN